MKHMIRIFLLYFVLTLMLSMFSGCTYLRLKAENLWPYVDKSFLYSEFKIIGKNSDEIQDIYGQFDYHNASIDEKGCRYNGWCGYLTAEGIPGLSAYWWLAPQWDEYYIIHFNEEGIADKVEKRHIPDGSWLMIVGDGVKFSFG